MRESETSFFFRYRKSYELFVTCKCHVGYIKVTVWGDLDPQLGHTLGTEWGGTGVFTSRWQAADFAQSL